MLGEMATIFGFEITRPARIRAAGSNFAMRTALAEVAAIQPEAAPKITRELAMLPYVKATGELPVTFPTTQRRGDSLQDRSVPSSSFDDWYLTLPNKINRKQIETILRQAAAGNLWNQYMLNQRMEQSWPCYKKCLAELKTAIASAKYVAHPYTLPGKRPTASAMEKADLVNRALNEGFHPDRFSDEDGCFGMIFDICNFIPMGISISEMMWDENATDPQGRNESLVRATAWVNPRNYAFSPDGRIGVAQASESGQMGFASQVTENLMTDPDKFIVAKLKSKSGSPLTAGMMRTLADIWAIIAYGRDFAITYMQKYGNPFFELAYDVDQTDQAMVDKYERIAQQAAAQGWVVYPTRGQNTNIKITPAHSMGGDNAQISMMKLADEACQLLLLGQTLTSDVGDSGSRALGDVHNSVRTEIIEHYASQVARILTEQFAESICRVNYGKQYLRNPERPTVQCDLTRPLSATEQADYVTKMSQSRIPVIAEPIYKRAGLEMPQPGDYVLNGTGEIVVMVEAMTPTEKRQKQFDEQLDQQLEVNQAMGESGQDMPQEQDAAQAVEAASPEDRRELEMLVTAAENAPHLNGEVVRVKHKLKELVTKQRR